MSFDLELYRVFHTVAHCRNISKAAERLYISQPAISKSIRKLEETLGVVLFVRNSRGVRLTREGSVLYEHVHKAMSELTVGQNVLEMMKANTWGTIRLCVSTTLCRHLLMPHLKTYLEQNPQIKFQILNRSTLETLRLIEEGAVDLGIVSQPFDAEGLEFLKLTDLHDVFVSSPTYVSAAPTDPAVLLAPPHALMLMEEANVTRRHIDRYLLMNGITVKPEIETGNMEILIDFARIGLGITVLIREFVVRELTTGELVEHRVEPPIPPRASGIAFKKDLPPSLAAQDFIRHLQNCYR